MVMNYPMALFQKSIGFVIQGTVMKQWQSDN